ncbi:TIGR00730 family Rossman fold protein [Hippea sp. KM1]|uniref:LOG family protein n=1 Tax=Hippea sp. KM1 TaxID=944481 RepID=UPI00046CC783|nr:TIGR00730 family Rossman fold protein [Hippea sp. KM1]
MKDIQKEFLENRNKNKDLWRLFKVLSDFTDAFEELDDVGLAVAMFGSARIKEDDLYYKKAYEMAKRFAEEGYAVITGGGPGIMEAANKGAHEAGGISVGLNIELPHEQKLNPYVNLPLDFRYFFTRKVTFMKYAVSFVVMPGGYGTMDELFESLVLIQTDKIGRFPVVLFGSEFWEKVVDVMRFLADRGYISESDLGLFKITDSVEEAVSYVIDKTRYIDP